MTAYYRWPCALLMLCLLGCGSSKPSGPAVLTTIIGPRTVQATVDGGGFISSEADNAIITSGAGKVRVEKDRVLLGEKEIAKIAAAATKIDVVYSNAALTVSADGAQVYPALAKK